MIIPESALSSTPFNSKNSEKLLSSLKSRGSLKIDGKAFSNNFYKNRRRQRIYKTVIALSIFGNICVWGLILFFEGTFSLGNAFALLITVITIAAIITKINIFDLTVKGEEKELIIWWLCCLRIGGGKKVPKRQKEDTLYVYQSIKRNSKL